MSFESQPNSFRAVILSGKRDPVVSDKKARRDRSAGGLDGVAVPRTEGRRGNHRGGDRHRLSNEQALVRFAGKEKVVALVNLSRGGAMVEGPIGAKLWDRLELTLGDSGAVECAVRWIKGDRYGLEFAQETRVECDPETMDAMLRDVIRNSFPEVEVDLGPVAAAEPEPEPEPGPENRVEVRHPLIWNGIVHHDYEWEAARLRNISITGALIECAVEFPQGATVFLELGEAGKFGATVSWSRGAQTGLQFSEPFDVRRLSKARPELAAEAAAWSRATLEELSRSLGG